MKKLALHWQIIIGLVLGLIYGLIAANLGWQEFTADWIAPWGNIFINMLKMIAVPLVLISLINGISGLKDVSQLSSMGGKNDRDLHCNNCYGDYHWLGHGELN